MTQFSDYKGRRVKFLSVNRKVLDRLMKVPHRLDNSNIPYDATFVDWWLDSSTDKLIVAFEHTTFEVLDEFSSWVRGPLVSTLQQCNTNSATS
ncbi:MAG: hypothetical protein DHS20C16_03420 [Phycisphaerae bacterium]|nr:MAG: hypothetical protein DHS20C16_03420 [Phycisphaerae bacterium]